MPFQIRKHAIQKNTQPETRYIDLASLPICYHKSTKYIECLARGMAGIHVPINCVHFREKIQSMDELKCMIRSMIFWGFGDNTPTAVYEYCSSPEHPFGDHNRYALRLIYSEIPEVKYALVIHEIEAIAQFMGGMHATYERVAVRRYSHHMLKQIMVAGVPLIRFLDATFNTIRGGKQIWMIAAAKFGKVDRVKCLVELGYPVTKAAIQIAEKNKHTECAEYLRLRIGVYDNHTICV